MMDIATLLSKVIAQNVKVAFHWAEIIDKRSVPRADVDIKLSGTDTLLTGIPHLHNYSPQVGDIALVLINGTDIVVIDRASI